MRKLIAVALVAGLLTGCNAEMIKQIGTGSTGQKAPADPAQVFGPIDQQVTADFDGDSKPELVALGALQGSARTLGILRQGAEGYALVAGRSVRPETTSVQVVELQGALTVVTSYERDGAPQFEAFRLTGGALNQVDYYTQAAPAPANAKGWSVTVNKYLNALWVHQDGKLVKAYRVATGRQTSGPAPTQTDYATNFFTPEGTFSISTFSRNPAYNALKPGDKSYAGGAPDNPLGTRWMGFSVMDWDGAWVWGIHGTNEPDLIGTWASDGCIRMFTQDAEELFDLIPENAPLHVVSR